jgi:putative glycosyltransferase (TIGR04372 family)
MNISLVRFERIRYAWTRIREEGVVWTMRELARRTFLTTLSLLLLPATLLLHLAGFRMLTVITERIGHFAAEIDCFLKLRALGQLPQHRYFIVAPPSRTANRCLADYWSRALLVVRHPLCAALLSTMSRIGLMRHDVSDYVLTVQGAATYFRVNREWAGRGPLLTLLPEHEAWGRERVAELGLPHDAWFACLHVREGGYSRHDEKVHAFRNADIESMELAIRTIVDRGGWCIRMGDPTMKPLPPTRGAIDYAHHELRSPELDVFLCARCRFFIGTSSGLYLLSSAFGVRSALVHMVPFTSMGFSPGDVSIPKLLYSEREHRYLTFPEVLASPVANYRMGKLLHDLGIAAIDSSPEEVEEVVLEMLDRLDGRTAAYEADEPLQATYRALLRPMHYCYDATSRLGARFLQRHRTLLTP